MTHFNCKAMPTNDIDYSSYKNFRTCLTNHMWLISYIMPLVTTSLKSRHTHFANKINFRNQCAPCPATGALLVKKEKSKINMLVYIRRWCAVLLGSQIFICSGGHSMNMCG